MMDRKRIIILIFLGVVLVGGGIFWTFWGMEKQANITQVPKAIKKTKESEEVKSMEFPTYSYDVENLRDPFTPLIVKRDMLKKGHSPLESYDIEEFKLTGIAWDKKGMYALIQAPDGKFYIVREKDKIGISGGRVVKILKDSIEIKEDNRKTKYLKLRTEEGA